MSLRHSILFFRFVILCLVIQLSIIYISWEQIAHQSTTIDQSHDVAVEKGNELTMADTLGRDSQQALEQAALSNIPLNFGHSWSAPEDFVYKNRKWAGDCPEIEYVINVNTDQINKGNGTEEDFRQAIINAARTWNAVSGADFVLSYGGETDATTTGYNGSNEIIFSHKGDTQPSGLARIWFTNDFVILEADIWINADYQWDATGLPSADELDLQSVAVHEFGHWLALGHDDSHEAIMFSTVTIGTVKRELHQNDKDGISFIYPRTADSTCNTGEVPSNTSTPQPTLIPSETPTFTVTPSPIPTSTPTATPIPSATPTPNTISIPTLTATIDVTTVILPTATDTATPTALPTVAETATVTATTPPPPDESGELQSNYSSGAPGSFFTIIGENYQSNQELIIYVVSDSDLLVQEQIVRASISGEFSIIIGTAGAPAGQYTINVFPRTASYIYQNVAAHVTATQLSLLLDPAELLRAQETINRTTELPTFEFPLISSSRLLYLPFIY